MFDAANKEMLEPIILEPADELEWVRERRENEGKTVWQPSTFLALNFAVLLFVCFFVIAAFALRFFIPFRIHQKKNEENISSQKTRIAPQKLKFLCIVWNQEIE